MLFFQIKNKNGKRGASLFGRTVAFFVQVKGEFLNESGDHGSIEPATTADVSGPT